MSPPLCEVKFPPPCEVECSSKFWFLTTQKEKKITIEIGAGDGERTPKAKVVKRKLDGKERKDRERLEGSQQVLILDDSRIRYLDGTFCEADRKRRMTCCLPGAGVQDVVKRYRRVVDGTGKEVLVVVHMEVNDVGRMRSKELLDRYR